MNSNPVLIASYGTLQYSIVASHGTRPRVIFTAGGNGARIASLSCFQDDNTGGGSGTPHSVDLYIGRLMTAGSAMGSGQLTQGTPDTITRSVGSFLTDGWLQDQRILIQGSTTLGNDVAAHLAAPVTSNTLSLTGGTLAATEASPSTANIYLLQHVSQDIVVPYNTGTALLTNANLPWVNLPPDAWIVLGPNEILAARVTVAMPSLMSCDIVGAVGSY